MGYFLTSLADLAVEDRIKLYFFLIGERQWKGGLADKIEDNFLRIGIRMGRNAAIVGGEREFDEEVARKYLGKSYGEVGHLLPALIITDAHPGVLEDGSLCLMAPLSVVEKRYQSFDCFMADLIAFAKGENDHLLDALNARPGLLGSLKDSIKFTVPLVPNFVVIDLKDAHRAFKEWKSNRAYGT